SATLSRRVLPMPSPAPASLPSPVARWLFFSPPPPPHFSPLSLHDALPISPSRSGRDGRPPSGAISTGTMAPLSTAAFGNSCRRRSEEHTSELQSLTNLVCRLLLEKKKKPANGSAKLSLLAQIRTSHPRIPT